MTRIQTILNVLVALVILPRPTVAQSVDPDGLFNDTVIHEIRLSVNTKDWKLLTDNWLDDTKYPADFRWNGQVVRNVAIHSRGGGSRRPNKVSLRVDFSHYTYGQTFHGLKSF